MQSRRLIIVFILALCALSPPVFVTLPWRGTDSSGNSGKANTRTAASGQPISGIDLDFDTAIAPGDNFFLYVNENWLKHHPIPPEHARWGVDIVLEDSIANSLHDILTNLTNEQDPNNPAFRKLRDFYTTAIDQAAIDRAGIAPLATRIRSNRQAEIDRRRGC